MIVGAAAVSVGSLLLCAPCAELCLHPVLQSELMCTYRLIAGEHCSVCSRNPPESGHAVNALRNLTLGAEIAVWVKHCPKRPGLARPVLEPHDGRKRVCSAKFPSDFHMCCGKHVPLLQHTCTQ